MDFTLSALIFLAQNAALMAGGYCIAGLLSPAEKAYRVLAALVIYISQILIIQVVLGAFGALRPLPVLALSVVVGAAGVLSCYRRLSEARPLHGTQETVGLSLLECFAIAAVLSLTYQGYRYNLFFPPAGGDSTLYHLPIMASTLITGGLFGLDVPFAYYPNNSELLSLWLVMPFKDDLLVALQNLAPTLAGVLTAFLLARAFKVRRDLALLFSLFVAVLPVVYLQLFEQENDTITAFAWLAGLLFLLRHFDTKRPGWLVIASLCAGIALGTKYSGMYYLTAFWLLLGAWYVVNGKIARLPRAFSLSLPFVLATGGFWYLRNYIEHENPFFPVGLKVFGVEVFKDDAAVGMFSDLPSTAIYHYFDRAEVYGLLARAFSHWLTPLSVAALIIAPAGIWVMRKRNANWWVVALGLFLALVILSITPLAVENVPGTMNQLKAGRSPSRYALPAVLVALLCLAVAADAAVNRLPAGYRNYLEALTAAAVTAVLWIVSPLPVIIGALAACAALFLIFRMPAAWRKALTVGAVAVLMVSFIAAGPSLKAEKNNMRAKVYGNWVGKVPYSRVYELFDSSISGCNVSVVGARPYPFLGASFENRLVPLPNPGLAAAPDNQPGKKRESFVVVTVYSGDPAQADYLRFPEYDELIKNYPEHFRLIYQDHFAHVYKVY